MRLIVTKRLPRALTALFIAMLVLATLLAVPAVYAAPTLASAAAIPWQKDTTIQPGTQIGDGWVSPNRFTHAYDMDGNGYHDFVLVDSAGVLWLYPATSTKTFAPRRQIGAGFADATRLIGGVDWNLDGRADLMVTFADGRLVYFQNSGTGSISAQAEVGSGWQTVDKVIGLQRSLNGMPALMATDAGGTLWAYPTNGKATVTGREAIGSGWQGMKHLAPAGDWDRNGSWDMVAIDSAGNMLLYAAWPGGRVFSTYMVNIGWTDVAYVAASPTVGTTTGIWAVSSRGALRHYNVTYGPQPAPPRTTPSSPGLFAYGSLRSGQSNNGVLVGTTRSAGLTYATGHSMYQVANRAFPYALNGMESWRTITGELFLLDPASAGSTISRVDAVERYNPGASPDNQIYVRTLTNLMSGDVAWTYVSGRNMRTWVTSNGTFIPTGDWLRR